MERKEIKDIAPNGVSGGMKAVLFEDFNGEYEFKVVAVDFEEGLVALDVFNDPDEPRWFRAESIKKIV